MIGALIKRGILDTGTDMRTGRISCRNKAEIGAMHYRPENAKDHQQTARRQGVRRRKDFPS